MPADLGLFYRFFFRDESILRYLPLVISLASSRPSWYARFCNCLTSAISSWAESLEYPINIIFKIRGFLLIFGCCNNFCYHQRVFFKNSNITQHTKIMNSMSYDSNLNLAYFLLAYNHACQALEVWLTEVKVFQEILGVQLHTQFPDLFSNFVKIILSDFLK